MRDVHGPCRLALGRGVRDGSTPGTPASSSSSPMARTHCWKRRHVRHRGIRTPAGPRRADDPQRAGDSGSPARPRRSPARSTPSATCSTWPQPAQAGDRASTAPRSASPLLAVAVLGSDRSTRWTRRALERPTPSHDRMLAPDTGCVRRPRSDGHDGRRVLARVPPQARAVGGVARADSRPRSRPVGRRFGPSFAGCSGDAGADRHGAAGRRRGGPVRGARPGGDPRRPPRGPSTTAI